MEINMEKGKGIIDFDKEIEQIKRKRPKQAYYLDMFMIFTLVIMPITLYLVINYYNGEELIKKFLGVLAFFVFYALFFGEVFNHIYPETLRKKYENFANKYKKDTDVLKFFYKNYFPDEYKEEFKNIFEIYYREDEIKFRNWIRYEQTTPRDLYIKLLENKKLQQDINEEILKKSIITISKNSKEEIVKQVEESNKKRKLEEKQIKMKNEMVNYFEKKE